MPRLNGLVTTLRQAWADGLVVGDGVTFCYPALAVTPKPTRPGGPPIWIGAMVEASVRRAARIADNAGVDGGVVCEKVGELAGNMGYNAATDKYEDLVKTGIIDPTKVTRSALQNAASVATLLLTSDALIAEMPKDGKKPGGHGDHDVY